jgi:hypothetical protein
MNRMEAAHPTKTRAQLREEGTVYEAALMRMTEKGFTLEEAARAARDQYPYEDDEREVSREEQLVELRDVAQRWRDTAQEALKTYKEAELYARDIEEVIRQLEREKAMRE